MMEPDWSLPGNATNVSSKTDAVQSLLKRILFSQVCVYIPYSGKQWVEPRNQFLLSAYMYFLTIECDKWMHSLTRFYSILDNFVPRSSKFFQHTKIRYEAKY